MQRTINKGHFNFMNIKKKNNFLNILTVSGIAAEECISMITEDEITTERGETVKNTK